MSKFKIGDNVVCIDNSNDMFIKKYEIYTVTDINNVNVNFIEIDNYKKCHYFFDRFISLKEYRKQKINDIFNEKG
jgi:hypothetical protein